MNRSQRFLDEPSSSNDPLQLELAVNDPAPQKVVLPEEFTPGLEPPAPDGSIETTQAKNVETLRS